MTKSSRGLQFRLEHLGIVVLVLAIIVLPSLQFATGGWASPGWDIAIYAILGVGIVVLTLLPWLRARPVRKLLTERLRENIEAVGSLATLWRDESGPSELVALVASRDGIEVVTPHSSARFFAWSDIADIQELYSAPGEPDMIVIVTTVDPGSMRLVPMRESGMYKLQVHLIADRVARLRAMRSG